jgi:hypothetical protein
MRGVITGREVAHHAGLIRREFGVRCLLRCLWALATGRPITFLELAWQCSGEPGCPPLWTAAPANSDEEVQRS